jgi:hypothetical protein
MSRLFRVFDDEFTVGFCGVDIDENGIAIGARYRRLRFDKERNRSGNHDRELIVAAAVIQEGERLQRPVVQRKLKKGSRNIKNKTGRPVQLLGWAMEPKLMATDNRKEKNRVLREFGSELHGVVQKIGEDVGLKEGLPDPGSYVITAEVMAVADKAGCADYFAEIEGQRFLPHDLAKIKAAINEKYPDALENVMEVIHATKNRDHLSMLSLEPSKEGGLFVVVMAPKGHHLKVEAKPFVEMVSCMGESKRLFVFPKQGDREVIESSFNDRKEGEVIGKISSFPMVLEVACCVGNGSIKNVVDKARFYLEPEYLLCLWMVLNKIILDVERYQQLKAKAETFTGFDPFTAGVS